MNLRIDSVDDVGRIFVLLAVLLLTGCAEKSKPAFPTVAIKGNVTIDGQPVEKGQLTFLPTGKGQPTTADIQNGKYEVPDAPQGAMRVTFAIVKETGKMNTEYSQPFPEVINLVPQKYRSGVDLNLSADGTHDFVLTSK